MNYKVFIYLLMAILSAYGISGINFDGFIRKRHVLEARILAFLLVLGLSYISGSFLISIIESM